MGANLAKNTLYLTVASVGQKVLAFVYFLYLARVLGPEQTGTYLLALSIIAIFSVVADFGITAVVIREVAKKPQDARKLVRRSLGVKLPFMLLAMLLANGAAWVLDYDFIVRMLVAVASFVLVADAFSLFFYGVLRGYQRLKFESLGVFIGQLTTFTFGAAVLFFFPSLPLLVGVLLLGSTFNAIFSATHVVRLLGVSALRPYWEGGFVRTLLKTALPFALAAIFVKVYSYVDQLLLGKLISEEAVGIYGLAYKLTYAFQFVPLAFVAALYPGLSNMLEENPEAVPDTFNEALWYMMLVATPITFGVWAIADQLVLLAGEGYTEAALVLQTLIFVLIPIFLDFPVGSLLNAANRQSLKTTIMGATMVLNVLLNVFLIPRYGPLGAAIAGLISFIFLFVVGIAFIPRILPGYRIASLIPRLLPILLSGIVMLVVTMLLKPVIGYILVIPVAAVIYGGMLFATGALKKQHVVSLRQLVLRGKKDVIAENEEIVE